MSFLCKGLRTDVDRADLQKDSFSALPGQWTMTMTRMWSPGPTRFRFRRKFEMSIRDPKKCHAGPKK